MEETTKMKESFIRRYGDILSDESLSFKAKGLFIYLSSKPQDWHPNYKKIVKDSSDGEAAVLSGLKELEENGYLIRRKKHNGGIEYCLTIN